MRLITQNWASSEGTKSEAQNEPRIVKSISTDRGYCHNCQLLLFGIIP
jgi:hypothetical protein